MRTAAQETAPQVALRNCSKEEGGEGQYIYDFGKRGIDVFKHTHTHIHTHIYIYIYIAILLKLLLVTRNSNHREEC